LMEVALGNEGSTVGGDGAPDEIGVIQHRAGLNESEGLTGRLGCRDGFNSLGCNSCYSSWVHCEFNV
jgi:hypothetical protein